MSPTYNGDEVKATSHKDEMSKASEYTSNGFFSYSASSALTRAGFTSDKNPLISVKTISKFQPQQ